MQILNGLMDQIVVLIWGTPTFALLLLLGIIFTVWTKLIQRRALTHGVALIRGLYSDEHDPGAISHFQALSTALSGTVGLGNIGGVALAVGIGGPGAVFWMWVTGFLGMAIKAVEVTLSMMYRDTSDPDNPRGGAMYVITRGWGDPLGGGARLLGRVVGAIFAAALVLATFTAGNMFQSWNVADITHGYFGLPQLVSGCALAVISGLVIIGGIRRIGDVTGILTPLMCGLYLVAGCGVLVLHAAEIPGYLTMIVTEAFQPTTAQGAFLGATAWFGLTVGLRRALFSNECGQGTSPVAHAAARTKEPAREGIVAGLEPFVDTCLVCTLTALVLLSTETWNRPSIGEFQGDVRLVASHESGGSWQVDASTSIDALPSLGTGEAWSVGHAFFLLAETPVVNNSTGSALTKLTGRIVPDESTGNGAVRIAWSSGSAETGRIDPRVYREFTGAALTGHAFDRAVPGLGKWLVTLTCWLFALSTMISWSYYGEQAIVYLFGGWATNLYKGLFCLAAVLASMPTFIRDANDLGNLMDLGSGCMLIANAPIVLFLGHRAVRELSRYLQRLDQGEFPLKGRRDR